MSEMHEKAVSLLLYLETCAVDNGGLVDGRRMNKEEFALARKWNDEGFLFFGRRLLSEIKVPGNTHYVVLTRSSFAMAGNERWRRARVHLKRSEKMPKEAIYEL